MTRRLEKVESELPKITGKDYKSPVKFDLEIQRQRILYILHSALKKMKIAAYIPFMLKHPCRSIKTFLKPCEVDFIKYACSKYMPGGQMDSMKFHPHILQYTRVLDRINLYEETQDEDVVKALLGSQSQNEMVDYHISQVIQIITSNEGLVNYINTLDDEVEEPVFNLIECMKHLRKLIYDRLMVTSKEQMDRDKRLRVAYKSNFVISQNITRLTAQLEKQRKELGAELDKKKAILNVYNTRLENLKDEFQKELMKKVQKSEKQMMNDTFNSEIHQVELEREAADLTNQYNLLLESNLNDEGQLRQRRNKVEAQLASWLAKYDNDVGEKQEELEKLEQEYEDMRNEYLRLMELFEEQSETYYILMGEKQEEEQRIFEEKAYEFLKNRAARRIQRAWRAYWQRKLERKKSKKGKGKGKGKKDKKNKPKKEKPKITRKTDANAVLSKKFKKKEYLFEEIDTTKEFPAEAVTVDLAA